MERFLLQSQDISILSPYAFDRCVFDGIDFQTSPRPTAKRDRNPLRRWPKKFSHGNSVTFFSQVELIPSLSAEINRNGSAQHNGPAVGHRDRVIGAGRGRQLVSGVREQRVQTQDQGQGPVHKGLQKHGLVHGQRVRQTGRSPFRREPVAVGFARGQPRRPGVQSKVSGLRSLRSAVVGPLAFLRKQKEISRFETLRVYTWQNFVSSCGRIELDGSGCVL